MMRVWHKNGIVKRAWNTNTFHGFQQVAFPSAITEWLLGIQRWPNEGFALGVCWRRHGHKNIGIHLCSRFERRDTTTHIRWYHPLSQAFQTDNLGHLSEGKSIIEFETKTWGIDHPMGNRRSNLHYKCWTLP